MTNGFTLNLANYLDAWKNVGVLKADSHGSAALANGAAGNDPSENMLSTSPWSKLNTLNREIQWN